VRVSSEDISKTKCSPLIIVVELVISRNKKYVQPLSKLGAPNFRVEFDTSFIKEEDIINMFTEKFAFLILK
jgi:hypothetical protein